MNDKANPLKKAMLTKG